MAVGAGIVGLGAMIWLAGRLPWLRIGRLPGDIAVQKGNLSLYFPIATSLLLSLLLTLGLWAVRMLRK